MTYFICYDISNAKRLGRVAKVLKNYGLRVQYSFFRCDVEKTMMEELRQKVLEIIDPNEDSFKIYALCAKCVNKITTLGSGSLHEEEEVIIL